LDNDSLNPQREGLNIECNSGQHLVRVYAVGSDVAAKIWNTRPGEEDLLKRIAELEEIIAQYDSGLISRYTHR
jgi:hypothetical protein